MPLGNGDVSLNVWTEPNGDVLLYIGKTDSWGDNGRLLKLGRLRFSLAAMTAIDPGENFAQRLSLQDGSVYITFGAGDHTAAFRVWVDANHPVVQVEVEGQHPIGVMAILEPWRTTRHRLPSAEVSDVLLGSQTPITVEPDTILHGQDRRIGWYHHNTKSIGPALTAATQGLDGFDRDDPLLHRTFGAVVTAAHGERLDDRRLRSTAAEQHRFSIYVHTESAATPEEWLERIDELAASTNRLSFAARRKAHENWWQAFWDRSWIHVSRSQAARPPPVIPVNEHAGRIGVDQNGDNPFSGEIGRMSIIGEALGTAALSELAGHREPSRDQPPTVASSTIRDALTVEAWIKPGGRGGRIFDKITPGGSDGVLFDIHPAGHLRAIVGRRTLTSATEILKPGEWTHVALVVDASGILLYHDGAPVARLDASLPEGREDTRSDAEIVSKAYSLQRFVNACAGRGRYPIKFNGSILTVPHEGRPGDADYRRWGPGYWWQNTRLPYISMCTSGDFEMMHPLFRMYGQELMPLFRHRTKRYFGHDGAFIPECIYFWGEVFTKTYGPEPFAEREDKLQTSGWHKWEWVSGPELVFMMLDYFDHTRDADFLRRTLLPTADAILTFFDQHYETDDAGKLVMHPSQALETWWDCTNPMPEIAGLHAIVDRLLSLPGTKRRFLREFKSKLPPLPLQTVDGEQMLAPAARFEDKRNIENPELYAIFPFRRVAFEKPNVELGIRALNHRSDRGSSGWRQDDIFMAYLGLADQARDNLVQRARNKHADSRFDAFWGPNYDWVPDQDHGGILLKALQAMLLQTDGKKIYLLPAWPADWDVSFKLHAPYRTVIECDVRDGNIQELRVTPAQRRQDVVVVNQQSP
ncbi:MAG: LamG domain-containing protein [bacterium]|nr:LamG domain-containing protein [bacterium]